MKNFIKKIKAIYRTATDHAIVINAVIFFIMTVAIGVLSFLYIRPTVVIEQLIFASYGMLFDIAVIGVLITWLNDRKEKRFQVQAYMNEIDDFRNWISEEAMFRTVGNIKRLNKNKVTEMNLVDCMLRNINLNYCDLTNSNLNSADVSSSSLIGIKMNNCRLNQTKFENSNLNQSEFIKAYATGANFKDSYLIKSDFESAYLIRTNFENALLIEANLKNSILADANFKNTSLYKADLTGATGLVAEQLVKVKSLYLTKLDPEIRTKLKELAPHLFNE